MSSDPAPLEWCGAPVVGQLDSFFCLSPRLSQTSRTALALFLPTVVDVVVVAAAAVT